MKTMKQNFFTEKKIEKGKQFYVSLFFFTFLDYYLYLQCRIVTFSNIVLNPNYSKACIDVWNSFHNYQSDKCQCDIWFFD